ncbi:MAG: non-ribosomal peptide synthetase [Acidimicrobiales bacterium]|nr:non-ribosomal peptide synthetase [Acidimicrobiales bacterium]
MARHIPTRNRSALPLAADLTHHGDRLAVVTGGQHITYADLAERVAGTAALFGTARKLVLIAAGNDLGSLVAYLAALQAGHPAMVVPGDNPSHVDALVDCYDPDVVVQPASSGDPDVRRPTSVHDLHPDLALLLCTSGSTGSAKVVRLSHRNVQSNAEAIAAYLDIRASDRAATSLPMHYCYGLSVVNSHLVRGGGLVLTDNSVVDPCFWDEVRAHGVTSFAGVPYTFDLLDRIGFASMSVPSLRYVTQAGGRLDPARVRRYAELGERDGWQLFVMYGQTEATARMAYLPPERARTRPETIGVPIPGGSFTIEPLPDDEAGDEGAGADTGELVYRGPNVMLGYAHQPGDLALGATIDALRTGDIARRTGDSLYQVVGRRTRFVKLFGLRIDLQRVEDLLGGHGIVATCTGDDEGLIVAVGAEEATDHVQGLVTHHLGLPASRVHVLGFAELPRRGNGKPDYAAITRHAHAQAATRAGGDSPAATGNDPVRAVFAEVLQRDDVTDASTFVGLGGDSLSYVEMSIRLEQTLGHLPPGWHTTPVGRLTPARRGSRLLRQVETSVVLRAVAIVLVVSTHADLVRLPGGAHVLLAVAGFNLARFQLGSASMARSIARVAVPSVGWIAAVAATTDEYTLAHVALVHGQVGAGTEWRYWFVEALVQILAVVGLAFAVPAVRRIDRRHAFGVALLVLVAALTIRFDLLGLPDVHRPLYRPHEIAWIFAVGWAAARASSPARRIAVTALAVPAVPGFFGDPGREALLLAGLMALLWVPSVRLPGPVTRVVGPVAGASLYIYLSHWQVYPPLLDRYGSMVAIVGAVAAGVGIWTVVQGVAPARHRATRRAGGLRAEGAAEDARPRVGGVAVVGLDRHVDDRVVAVVDV